MAEKKNKRKNYINKEDLTAALVEYKAQKEIHGDDLPVPDYICECLFEIANRLSRSSNYIGYSYRQDMIMDGFENCFQKVDNFDVTAETRGGKPNPFGYFTQICWYAFVRRINKENHQQSIKESFIQNGNLGDFAVFDDGNAYGETMVEKMRLKRDAFFDPFKDSGEYDKATRRAKEKNKPKEKKVKESTSHSLI